MGELLLLKDIHVRFNGKKVLAGISKVFKGGVLVVAGPNGAGKTTLLNILSGLIVPYMGECRVMGTKCSELPRAGNGPPYVRESLPPSRMRVSDFVDYVTTFREIDINLMRENLRMLGFNPDIAWVRRLNSLSAGERTKVYVSLALSIRSTLYLLDEPNTNLDQDSREGLKELVARKVREGASFVITTHIYEYLDDLATEALILKEGKTVFSGPVEKEGELCIAWFSRGMENVVINALGSLGLSIVSLGHDNVVFRCSRDDATKLLKIKGVRRVEIGGLRALYASVIRGEGDEVV